MRPLVGRHHRLQHGAGDGHAAVLGRVAGAAHRRVRVAERVALGAEHAHLRRRQPSGRGRGRRARRRVSVSGAAPRFSSTTPAQVAGEPVATPIASDVTAPDASGADGAEPPPHATSSTAMIGRSRHMVPADRIAARIPADADAVQPARPPRARADGGALVGRVRRHQGGPRHRHRHLRPRRHPLPRSRRRRSRSSLLARRPLGITRAALPRIVSAARWASPPTS